MFKSTGMVIHDALTFLANQYFKAQAWFYAKVTIDADLAVDTDTLVVDATNNRVGIGTASPSVQAEISGTAPILQLKDTTTSAKSLRIAVDANIANLIEAAGASGSLLTLDLANNRVGVGTASPAVQVDVSGTAPVLQMTDTTASAKSLRMTVDSNIAELREAAGASGSLLTLDLANARLGVGTASPDATVQCVGTLRTGEDTTNYANFSTNGTLTLAGTARVNQIVNLGIDGLPRGVAAPAAATTGNFYGYKFSINDDGFVRAFEVPYDWDSATAMEFKIHWACDNASSGKKIKFQLTFSPVAEGTEQVNGAGTSLNTGDVAVSTTAYRLTESSISLAAAYFAFDDVIGMNVKRIATAGGAAEEPDDEPIVLGLELEYTADKLGEAT